MRTLFFVALMLLTSSAFGIDTSPGLPNLDVALPQLGDLSGHTILALGAIVSMLGILFGLYHLLGLRHLATHKRMLEVSNQIYENSKAHLLQQTRLVLALGVLVFTCIVYYFSFLIEIDTLQVALILVWSTLGLLTPFSVAWLGLRLNNYAISRTSFAALGDKPYSVADIPIRAGMSLSIFMICIELILMIMILALAPAELTGACLVCFALGESASTMAYRLSGGIFSAIAKSTDTITDESTGPFTDDVETYGLTTVALIYFIISAVGFEMINGTRETLPDSTNLQAQLVVWIFALRIMNVVAAIFAFWLTRMGLRAKYFEAKHFDTKIPLTTLRGVSSILSMTVTYTVSYFLIGEFENGIWWKLSTIISCGTLAATLLPHLTKVGQSTQAHHNPEVSVAPEISGVTMGHTTYLASGQFTAFWQGLMVVTLMFAAYWTSQQGLDALMLYPSVLTLGLLAFGFLNLLPVTITMNACGFLSGNAKNIFKMTQIETLPNIGHEIEKEFGFKPDFERPKVYLEENNATRNKSKAATLPVFTSTTVMGALTMLLSMRLLLNLKIDLADPQVLMGFFIGGAVTYWLNGASLKAAMSGTIRSIDHIKNTFKEDEKTPRKSIENSMRAVKVFAQFARLSTINIYGAAYFLTLAFAFWSPTFFASYSISVILFGFYQGVFIAKTVGATGNNTETLTANPFMKFTILFGFLATEISVKLSSRGEFTEMTSVAAGIMATTGLVFIWRSMDALKKT